MDTESSRPRWLNSLVNGSFIAFPLSFIGRFELFTNDGGRRSEAIITWAFWFTLLWFACSMLNYVARRI